MEIRVRFVGGPIDGEAARVTSLREVQVFFPPTERVVIMYRRDPMVDELVYTYDLPLSTKATEQYDKVREYFNGEEPSVVAWEEVQAEPFDNWGDRPITEFNVIDDTEEEKQ